jgi:hypothetical protein
MAAGPQAVCMPFPQIRVIVRDENAV